MALGYFVWRYRSTGNKNERAIYTHGNPKLEVFFTVLTAVVFVTLAVLGQRVWIGVHLNAAAADAVHIEVTGQQFLWNFRYPGPDGKFGNTKPELYNDEDNSATARPGPLGIDPADPAGKDDLVSVGTLVVPVNREVNLTLRSKDVTHSLFLPSMRFKQDTVPGLKISLHFKPVKEGRYEIAAPSSAVWVITTCAPSRSQIPGRIRQVAGGESQAIKEHVAPSRYKETSDVRTCRSSTRGTRRTRGSCACCAPPASSANMCSVLTTK